MSSRAVSGFSAINISELRLRATYPCLLARMVYQVGSPAMFDGNRFLPETGIPMRKMLRSSTLFADCEPEPLTVATWMLKSLTTCFCVVRSPADCTATSDVAIFKSYPQARPVQVFISRGEICLLEPLIILAFADGVHRRSANGKQLH